MKKFFAILLAFIVTFTCLGATAFASEAETPVVEEDIDEDINTQVTYNGSSWTFACGVASSSGMNVTIDVVLCSNCRTAVRLCAADGSVVWTGTVSNDGDISANGRRTYWCGSNVAKVYLKLEGIGMGVANVYG